MRKEYLGGGRRNRRSRWLHLHRIILERVIGRPLEQGEQVDHIDGNPLNNHRSNLRVATQAENMRNRGMHRNNQSGLKGVCWRDRIGKWQAQIWNGRTTKHLGYFETAETAHEAYWKVAQELYGEFANKG